MEIICWKTCRGLGSNMNYHELPVNYHELYSWHEGAGSEFRTMSVTSWQKSHKSVQILQNILLALCLEDRHHWQSELIIKDLFDLKRFVIFLAKRLLTGNFIFSTMIYSALRAEISQIFSKKLNLRIVVPSCPKLSQVCPKFVPSTKSRTQFF